MWISLSSAAFSSLRLSYCLSVRTHRGITDEFRCEKSSLVFGKSWERVRENWYIPVDFPFCRKISPIERGDADKKRPPNQFSGDISSVMIPTLFAVRVQLSWSTPGESPFLLIYPSRLLWMTWPEWLWWEECKCCLKFGHSQEWWIFWSLCESVFGKTAMPWESGEFCECVCACVWAKSGQNCVEKGMLKVIVEVYAKGSHARSMQSLFLWESHFITGKKKLF